MEKALRKLLEAVRRIFPFDFQLRQLNGKADRIAIVSAVRECLNFHKLSRCLQAIGLSKTAYRLWASEIAFCKQTKRLCTRRKHSQLTDEEAARLACALG
jgi:hypothetical protein